MQNKTTLAVAGVLILAAVVYLIISSTGSTAQYFLTIAELQTLGAEARDRNLTVSGAVLGDTIVYDSLEPQVKFTIVHVPGDPQEVERRGGLAQVLHDAVHDPAAPRLEVIYDSVKPDLLQHEAQAIVRGRLGEDGRFYADELLLKCPTRYEEEVPEQSGAVLKSMAARPVTVASIFQTCQRGRGVFPRPPDRVVGDFALRTLSGARVADGLQTAHADRSYTGKLPQ